ncbi:Translocation and assembly module subunit TamB [Candidatus Providencia siddallii]|uniref:Translocation and assembly module subunit TamB n=1 Tax=Candidatus Providencia siddallii TaxID=1715285 RepID=A0ABM9NPE0_9GAMM
MLSKFLKYLIISLILVFIIIFASLSFLLYTESGLNFFVNIGTKYFIPELTIKSIKGNIKNLRLYNIKYKTNNIDINSNEIKVKICPNRLIKREFYIETLKIDKININIQNSLFFNDISDLDFLKKINRFFTIRLNKLYIISSVLNINDINIDSGKTIIHFLWKKKNINIIKTDVVDIKIDLLNFTKKYFILKTSFNNYDFFSNQIKNILSKLFLIKPNKIVIPINLNINKIFNQNFIFKKNKKLIINNFNFIIFNKEKKIFLKKININTSEINIFLSGILSIKNKFLISLDGIYNFNKLKYLNNKKNIFSIKCDLFDKLYFILKIHGLIDSILEIKANLLKTKSFILNLNDIHLNLNSNFFYNDIILNKVIIKKKPILSKLNIECDFNKKQLKIKSFRLITSQINSNITGFINFNKIINWNFILSFSKINLNEKYDGFPLKIKGKAAINGKIYEKKITFNIYNFFLDGIIKNRKLKFNSKIEYNSNSILSIKQFNLFLGKNHLKINGIIINKHNFNIKLNIFLNEKLFFKKNSIINCNIKLFNNFGIIKTFINFNIYNLNFKNNIYIKNIKIKGMLSTDKKINNEFSIFLYDFKRSNFILKEIIFYIKNNKKINNFKIYVVSNQIKGCIILTKKNNYSIKDIYENLINIIYKNITSKYQLEEKTFFKNIKHTRKFIGSNFLLDNFNKICVLLKLSEIIKYIDFNIVLDRLDAKIFESFISKNIRINGLFFGKINIIFDNLFNFPKININLQGEKIKITKITEDIYIPIELNSINLNMYIEKNKIYIDVLSKKNNLIKLKSRIQISNIKKNNLLFGQIEIKHLPINIGKYFIKNKKIINCEFNTNLILKGTIINPLIYGNIYISNIKIESSEIPIVIRNGNLKIIFNGIDSILKGELNTYEGFLNFHCKLNWKNINLLDAKLVLKGKNLYFTFLPIIQTDVQMDVVLKFSSSLLTINGTIDFPSSRIFVNEIPISIINQSSDVIMLDEKDKQITKKLFFLPICTNLKIKIGNDVKLNAFGLDVRLNGLLNVIQNIYGLHVNGQVDIQSGHFSTYGQDLLIRKGQILFSGSIDQPFLNFEAIRNPDNTSDGVIAGVNFIGFADNIKINVFSEPFKTQQEAFSYLIKGEGINSNSITSSYMKSILIGLSIAKSGVLIDKIGKILGLSDLTLDLKGLGNDSQVIVTGKITNDLQIKYGVGIFDSLATLTLRYQLIPKLYLEVVSGINHALDIIYQFDF